MEIIKTTYQLDIINRVRTLRLNHDVSQIKIAKLLDVSNGYIGNVESPKYQHKYTLKQLWILANFFNVSLDYLFTGKEVKLTTEQLINILIAYDE